MANAGPPGAGGPASPSPAAVLLDAARARRAAGQAGEAERLYRQALALDPGCAEAHAGLGGLLLDTGRLEAAEAAYRRAVGLRPRYAEAHNDLGVVLRRAGRPREAEASCRQALAVRPDYPMAFNTLGSALGDQGRWEEAAAAYRRAISSSPDFADACNNLGVVLKRMGRLDEAAAAYERAIALKPRSAIVLSNLGSVRRRQGRLDEAVSLQRRAVALAPGYAKAHNNLGGALKDLGLPDQAAASYDRALALKPDYAEADSNRLLCLGYDAAPTAEALFAEHRLWDRRHDRFRLPPWTVPVPPPDPDRRLRIGYVSGDFRTHPVGYFMLKVLAAHDPSQVESLCYSSSALEDGLTQRLRAHAHRWRSLVGVSDEAAAGMIRGDAVDILVDLSGHTAGNRLPLFTRRPAPVQASWLGYPGSTGLASIDYLITDVPTAPAGAQARSSEAIVRLPDIRWCYAPPDHAPAVAVRAAGADAPLTFGSFNNLAKLGPGVVRLWSRVLQAAPGSRLRLKWLSLADVGVRARLQAAFAAEGIARERLEFEGHSPHPDLLAAYGAVDIALDPFPFGGGLTSCEALWMGVPVVTLAGDRPASRQTLALLHVLGLDELCAESEADYVRIASALAADPGRRAHLRAVLRPRMAASPLCDGPLFTAALETAMRRMWRRWCAGLPPEPFDVPAAAR